MDTGGALATGGSAYNGAFSDGAVLRSVSGSLHASHAFEGVAELARRAVTPPPSYNEAAVMLDLGVDDVEIISVEVRARARRPPPPPLSRGQRHPGPAPAHERTHAAVGSHRSILATTSTTSICSATRAPSGATTSSAARWSWTSTCTHRLVRICSGSVKIPPRHSLIPLKPRG